MHPGAFEFISRHATTDEIEIIEIGSRDINGSIRCHFPAAIWTGIDLIPGPSVDIVCDACEFSPVNPVDAVVCCEVFEHCSYWSEILQAAESWLKPGGKILISCAGPGRDEHSAIDGGELRTGEHYANITADRLAEELHFAGFSEIYTEANEHWRDTYASAIKN